MIVASVQLVVSRLYVLVNCQGDPLGILPPVRERQAGGKGRLCVWLLYLLRVRGEIIPLLPHDAKPHQAL